MTDILIRSAETFVHGAADDCVRANVESEANAGMRPMIVRSSDGNCCAWCSELAGEYYADEAPDDIYARHDNCTCTVTYVSERGAQDAHTKSWIDKEEENARRERIDGDQKYINDLRVQRMRERAARVGDVETFKEKEQAIRRVHATGRNEFNRGFTEKNLKEHFGPSGRHTYQYPDWTSEKYEQEALKLVQSRTTDDIIGYKTIEGAVVRYRRSTNDMVVGYPRTGISTMFKPKDDQQKGYRFVLRRMKRDGLIHD